MEEELDVALGARNGRRRRGYGLQSYLTRSGRHFLYDARLDIFVPDDPLPDLGPSRFELRLHQGDDVGVRAQQRRDDWEDLPQRDERDVDRHDADRPWQVRQLQMPRVEVLDDDDARVVAKRPVDLAVADVERDDAR